MEWDHEASNPDRLVFAQRARPRIGVALAVLGPILGIAILGLTAAFGGTLGHSGGVTTRHFSVSEGLLMLFGLLLPVVSLPWGMALAREGRLVLERSPAQLIRSWNLLGLGNTWSERLGTPESASWAKRVVQEGGGTSGTTNRVRYAVNLFSRDGGRFRMHTLFVLQSEEDAERVVGEIGDFFGFDREG